MNFRRVSLISNKLLLCSQTAVSWLVEPSSAVEERRRRRLKFLSGFLLLFAIQTLTGAIVVRTYDNVLWISMVISSVLLATAYIFSRFGYYRITVIFAISIPAVTPLMAVILGTGQDFWWLLLPLLLSGMFLSRKFVIVVAGVYFIMVASQIPFNLEDATRTIEWLAFMFVASVLSVGVASIRQQDQIEIENQLEERKKAERRLEQSRNVLKTIVESMPYGIITIDTDN